MSIRMYPRVHVILTWHAYGTFLISFISLFSRSIRSNPARAIVLSMSPSDPPTTSTSASTAWPDMAHTNVIADVAPPSTAGGTPSGGLGWPHQVVGLTSNPPAKRKRRETAWWRKKSEANASILIIIHVGSLGNVQSTCHISVTCIHGYIWTCSEQLKNFMDPEMQFQSFWT